MTEFGLQRRNMVESQVRPSDVTDRRITAAMLAIPREQFVPPGVASLAYIDETLEFGTGDFLIAPRALAKLIQLADIDSNDKVLVLGSACGYAAAVVANLARDVTAVVSDEAPAGIARAALNGLGIQNVKVTVGPLNEGSVAAAPFAAIVIEGAVEEVPGKILAQLRLGGRVVAIERRGGIGRALLITKTDVLDRRTSFELAGPLLPGFEAEKALFAF